MAVPGGAPASPDGSSSALSWPIAPLPTPPLCAGGGSWNDLGKVSVRRRPIDERLASGAASEAPAARVESAAVGVQRLFSAMGNAAVARMLQRAPADGAASGAALEGVRKDVLDNVTGPIVEARSLFEATPPDYTKAFVAASQAEGALERIRGGSGRLAPEIQAALATRGPHIATVHLEALEYSGGDMPAGVRSGINRPCTTCRRSQAPKPRSGSSAEPQPHHHRRPNRRSWHLTRSIDQPRAWRTHAPRPDRRRCLRSRSPGTLAFTP
jgi:hypothetical protein